jgi:hypothetical protein
MSIYRNAFSVSFLTFCLVLQFSLAIAKDLPSKKARNTQSYQSGALSWKQKEIIITVWNVSDPDSSIYPNLARENYNTIPINVYNTIPTNKLLESLEIADKNGLKSIFRHKLIDPASLHVPAKKKELDDLVDKVKKHRGLEAYYITDEPGANKFKDYAELIAYLRKKDPSRLAYLNLLPIYANEQQLGVSLNEVDRKKIKYPMHLHGVGSDDKAIVLYLDHLRKFVSIVKPNLISYDHYHLFSNGDGQKYFLNLALISQVSKEARVPFMNIIQAGLFLKEWRLPTAREVRFQVYTTLAYGGKGISYFTYWGSESDQGLYRDGKQSALAKDVSVLNAEIKKLSPTLIALDSNGVYNTSPLPLGGEAIPMNSPVRILSKGEFVIGLFGKNKKTSAFMIANRNYKSKQLLNIDVLIVGKKLQELDRKTGKWSQVSNLNTTRRVKLFLEPGDGRFFRVI